MLFHTEETVSKIVFITFEIAKETAFHTVVMTLWTAFTFSDTAVKTDSHMPTKKSFIPFHTEVKKSAIAVKVSE